MEEVPVVPPEVKNALSAGMRAVPEKRTPVYKGR